MNNKGSMTLNSHKNLDVENENDTEQQKQSSSNFAGRAAAIGAGVAFSTGSVMAAEQMFSTNGQEEIKSEETLEAEQQEVEPVVVTAEPMTDHIVSQTIVVESASHDSTNPSTIPSNAEYIDNSAEVESAASSDSDNEVHVLGIESVETEYGTHAILVGLEAANGDRAVVVDIDSDGTIDYIAHDDNGDGKIDTNHEIYDVHNAGLSTGTYVDVYAHEQIYGTGDNEYLVSDDLPDYMNDADTGIIDM